MEDNNKNNSKRLPIVTPHFSWATLIMTILVVSIITIITIIPSLSWAEETRRNQSIINITVSMLFALIQGTIIYIGIYFVSWLYYRFWQKEIIESELESLQNQINEDFFTNLVKINFKYIDKYYLQTQVQADKSFLLSCIAAVISLIITTVGIIMMFNGYTEPAYVTTGAGVLGELVASVFFYLYNRTVIKMSEYHQKLVLTQNINLALKISEELAEPQKSKSRAKLIDALSQDVNMYLSSPSGNFIGSDSNNKANPKEVAS